MCRYYTSFSSDIQISVGPIMAQLFKFKPLMRSAWKCVCLSLSPCVRSSVCLEPCLYVCVIGCVNHKRRWRRSRRSGQCQGQRDMLLLFTLTTQRGFSVSFIIPPSPALTIAAASLRASLSLVVKACR